ncbi:hypothetical protein [Actinoplanes sp. NPDC026619]|uniref:hypothetical protein n=1 Tax=Actinoplanes sp. NPDC026619 TaxID=3155798 RepID=UPI0033DCCE20
MTSFKLGEAEAGFDNEEEVSEVLEEAKDGAERDPSASLIKIDAAMRTNPQAAANALTSGKAKSAFESAALKLVTDSSTRTLKAQGASQPTTLVLDGDADVAIMIEYLPSQPRLREAADLARRARETGAKRVLVVTNEAIPEKSADFIKLMSSGKPQLDFISVAGGIIDQLRLSERLQKVGIDAKVDTMPARDESKL